MDDLLVASIVAYENAHGTTIIGYRKGEGLDFELYAPQGTDEFVPRKANEIGLRYGASSGKMRNFRVLEKFPHEEEVLSEEKRRERREALEEMVRLGEEAGA